VRRARERAVPGLLLLLLLWCGAGSASEGARPGWWLTGPTHAHTRHHARARAPQGRCAAAAAAAAVAAAAAAAQLARRAVGAAGRAAAAVPRCWRAAVAGSRCVCVCACVCVRACVCVCTRVRTCVTLANVQLWTRGTGSVGVGPGCWPPASLPPHLTICTSTVKSGNAPAHVPPPPPTHTPPTPTPTPPNRPLQLQCVC
jgi:hypothetical protein